MSAPDELIAGRYRLVNRVGRGGMGVVWEAWDERLHRRVAVKQLHAQAGLGEAEAELANLRAMREARITARLDHPHAVPVFDVVEHEGRPCLIMQFLPSTPLSEILRERHTLPLADTARIGAQIASALAAAHRAGIVHRDVKPGNVLIAGDGTARISDFGISHALGDSTLTATGMVHGTPAYLAPEVARGADSTFASDVFGLGATLYTAREGEPPFGKDQNSIALLYKVASGNFTPPTQSGSLTPLVLRMLAPDPEGRPDMGEVARTLTGLAADSGAEPDTLRFAEADVVTVTSSPPTGRPWTRGVPATEIAAPAAAAPEATAPAPAAAVPVDPPPADPPPAATSGPAPERRGRLLLWVTIAVAALLGVAALAYALAPGAGGPAAAGGTPSPAASASRSAASSSASASTSTSPSASPTASPTQTPTPTPTPSASTARPSPSATDTSDDNSGNDSKGSDSKSDGSKSSKSTKSAKSGKSSADNGKGGDDAKGADSSAPTAAALARAVTSYYALMPRQTDAGWARLTPSYRKRAGGRSSYDRFWRGMDRVSVTGVRGTAPDRVVATVRYVYNSGKVVRERTSYRMVPGDDSLLINSTTVLSSVTQ